jgi:hypothetical protein
MKYSSYLVCNEHIDAVAEFLKQFFEEEVDGHTWSSWRTFKVGDTGFTVNLMVDNELSLTQYMTFEIYCKSLEELNELAEKYNARVQSLLATSAPQHYNYHYAEVLGPANICKVEMSYTEDIQ